MDVRINDSTIDVPQEVCTWGDLLDWLETDHLKAGQCITKVSLGGSEEINYRNRSLCELELQKISHIEVESGDFDTVIRESLGELDNELANAIAGAGEIVRLFERREPEEAYRRLAQLLETIRVFVSILSEDLGWADDPRATISTREFSSTLEKALVELIKAQENEFWVSICDVLEYEITPILEAWKNVVQRTRVQIN